MAALRHHHRPVRSELWASAAKLWESGHMAATLGRSIVALALAAGAAGFLALCLIGAWRGFAWTPIADSWDGYVGFYIQAASGRLDAWISPANEHRLLFSRLLFWIDLHYLGGKMWLLLAANFALMAMSWGLLTYAGWRLLAPQRWLAFALACALTALCFSWMQWQNITWEYQSQFFGAYAFPLAAFVLLALSAEDSAQRWKFGAACLFGCLAATTMANGTLVLPLMALAALLMRRAPALRAGLLACLSAIVLGAYFHDYQPRAATPVAPRDMLVFVLEFFGAPAHALFDRRELAAGTGALFLAVVGGLFIAWWRDGPRREPLALALLVFLAYVLLTTLLAARRRAGWAEDAAFAPRYATAVVSAWAAMVVLVVQRLRAQPAGRWSAVTALALCMLALFPRQLSAMDESNAGLARARYLGALALNIDVRDESRIRMVYPSERIYEIAHRARARNLSVFGSSTMVRTRDALGRAASELQLERCDGRIDSRAPVLGDKRAAAVRGWAFDRRRQRTPREVYLVDGQGTVVGVAITGRSRKNIAALVGRAGEPCDFDGYVLRVDDEPLSLWHLP